MFVRLTHAPGKAQADSRSLVWSPVKCKADYFAMVAQSDDVRGGVPAETRKRFLEGHVRPLAYFEGVPRRFLRQHGSWRAEDSGRGGERKSASILGCRALFV